MMHARSPRDRLRLFALLTLVGGAVALAPTTAAAAAPKPEKIPVALGSWTGASAATFKGAMRRGLGKECRVVGAKAARVIINGAVTPQGRGFVVRVIVKLPKSGEVIEQRDFTFPGPKPSNHQSDKMGHTVAEIARRAPAE